MKEVLMRWGERRFYYSVVWAIDGQRGKKLHSVKKVMIKD